MAVLMVLAVSSYRLLIVPQIPMVPWQVEDSMEVYVRLHPMTRAQMDRLKAGDSESDPAGRMVAELLEILSTRPLPEQASLGGGLSALIRFQDPRYEVLVKLRLHGTFEQEGDFLFRRQPVAQHREISFQKTEQGKPVYSVSGVILSGKPVEVYIRLRSVDLIPEIVRRMSEGDKLYNKSGSPVGRLIGGALIPENGSEESQQLLAYPINEQGLLRITPASRDRLSRVDIWIALNAHQGANRIYYEGKPLIAGQPLSLESDEYAFSGEVVDFSERTVQVTSVAPKQEQQETVGEERVVSLRPWRVTLHAADLPCYLVEAIHPEDAILGPMGGWPFAGEFPIIGKIISVESKPPANLFVVEGSPDGALRLRQTDGRFDLKVVAELLMNPEKDRIGQEIPLITKRAQLNGTISKMEPLEPDKG
ncbi:MAG: hypothetical protein COV76_01695 [Candidatus Omnitrophica bacterium CG11_big_fil_rev_8_21_14_0_20_64_10]|nr:MAG: hypothetical protein COV76_01695 [Candidatus Omnitrophica bacterium CG11_big_fil_rev_8_21_14_0_20_64_10]